MQYLRAINASDMNQRVGKMDLSTDSLGVYSSLPVVNYKTYGATSKQLAEYEIEVLFLKLVSSVDEIGEDVEVILDDLELLVDAFYKIMRDKPFYLVEAEVYDKKKEGIEIQTTERLVGWRLLMTIPYSESIKAC